MEKGYRNAKAIVHLIKYHFVFCPRYRRKVLVGNVGDRFKELIKRICKENDWRVITIEVMPDYCYLFLQVLPTDSPSDIMAKVKWVTSRILRQEFNELSHLESLWTRSYFVSTAENVSSETIISYVEKQKKRG